MPMANIGETCKAADLGYAGRSQYVYSACPGCGTTRWNVTRLKDSLCKSCAADKRSRKLRPITYIVGQGEPKLGDTIKAKSLGYPGRGIMVYASCHKCQSLRWVRSTAVGTVCVHCVPKKTGHNHPRWNDRRITKRGYISVRISKDDSYYSMSNNGWVLEHRIVVARKIGRVLTKDEVVHHINGVKSDNREENLRLLLEKNHNSHLTIKDMQEAIRNLEKRITQLEAEAILLRTCLPENRDSFNSNNLNLQSYNTPSDCPDKTIEGIVQPFSNEGEDKNESA